VRLDDFVPRFQFHEVHTRRIAAPPEQVYEAVWEVRADEIAFFRLLVWLRRGGRNTPLSILNPGTRAPLLEVATRTGFTLLADDRPRELVIGMAVIGTRDAPDSAFAAMNFLITPDGDASLVRTETRIFANSDRARRRFGWYWRLIYPGSAFIRRMWLRAIGRRALRPPQRP
jgi:hypothetical protein